MRKFLAVLVTAGIAALAAPAASSASYSDALAAHTRWQQKHCGISTLWACYDWDIPTPPNCFWNPNGSQAGFWDCNGQWTEVEILYGSRRGCQGYTHFRNGSIFFWHDLCNSPHYGP